MAGEHAATGALLRAWCQFRPHAGAPRTEDYLSPCPDGSLTSGQPGPDHRVAMISTRPSTPARTRDAPAAGGRSSRWPCSALFATGCQTPIEGADDDREPVTLVVSETWVQSHQGSGGEAAARMRRSLQDAVEPTALRTTHTGWVGRQDDVTGFLAELSGGSWPGEPGGVHGRARPGPVRGRLLHAALRGRRTPRPSRTSRPPGRPRRSATVPVLDATLVFTGRGSARQHRRPAGHRRPRPGLPRADRRHHADDHRRAGDDHRGRGVRWDHRRHRPGSWCCPPAPACWRGRSWSSARRRSDMRRAATTSTRTPVTSSTSGRSRPRSLAAGAPPRRPVAGGRRAAATPTASRSPAPTRSAATLTAYGLQTGDGVELTDTTTAAWDAEQPHRRDPDLRRLGAQERDPAARQAGRSARARRSPTRTRSPRRPTATGSSTTTRASAATPGTTRAAPLISSVHFGPEDYCNAFFAGYLRQPQMVYGNPCVLQGQAAQPDLRRARHRRRTRSPTASPRRPPDCSTPASRARSTRASPTTSATSSAT